MEIPDAELKELMDSVRSLTAEVKELKSGEGLGSTRILKRITDRKVDVRRIDGKVVIGYRNRGSDARPIFIYEKTNPRDPAGPKVLYVDLILEGMKESEALPVDFKEFRTESERVTCKVTKTNEEEWEINQGTVKRKEVDGYSMVELDFDVPMTVVGKYRSFTVQIPDQDGREVTLSESYVNIA